jgi:hypothetical protein
MPRLHAPAARAVLLLALAAGSACTHRAAVANPLDGAAADACPAGWSCTDKGNCLRECDGQNDNSWCPRAGDWGLCGGGGVYLVDLTSGRIGYLGAGRTLRPPAR